MKSFWKFAAGDIVPWPPEAAAVSGGLAVGQIYRNGDVLQIVH